MSSGTAPVNSEPRQSHKVPPDSATEVELTTSGQSWTLLADHIEGFVEAWDGEDAPPSIAEFLPETTGPLRRLTLLEIIKIDLEYRWLHHSLPRKIEQYLEEFPDLCEEGFPCDLVYEEFHVRRQSGEEVEPQEYFERFPQHVEQVGQHLGIDTPYTPTSLFQGKSTDKFRNIQPGEKLDDFDLLATLGKGAFATVFLARQVSMQRLVALKVSANHGAEPQTLAQFDHENIVRVYDHRSLSDQGLRLLYMQYVRGGTLQPVVDIVREATPEQCTGQLLLKAVDRSLDNRGESAPAESSLRNRLAETRWSEVICWIGSRLAGALGYSHRRGVLHRDVKPANVLLTAEGAPKLADFNISFSAEVSNSTPAAYFGGSLPYMSPEQLEAFHPGHTREANSLDERCDIYSLGVVLWELLTGYRPFRDGQLEEGWTATLDQMISRRREGVGEKAIQLLPDHLPHGLKNVLLSCLAANPADRPQSGRELAQQLELCLQPRLQELLNPPEKSWQRKLLRFPMLVLLLAAFVPNILAAWFNYAYNEKAIIDVLAKIDPNAPAVFKELIIWINGIVFPIAFFIALKVIGPLAKGVHEARNGVMIEQERLASLWKRTLNLGNYGAVIGITLWIIAGIAYPISIHVALERIPGEIYPHFIASMLLCGLIAASYPFLFLAFFCVRVYYPALLTLAQLPQQNFPQLTKLGRRTRVYFKLAGLIIFFSILALVTIQTEATFAIQILCIAGVLGSGIAFWLYRAIQADLAVLAIAAVPHGEMGDIDHESLGPLSAGSWRA